MILRFLYLFAAYREAVEARLRAEYELLALKGRVEAAEARNLELSECHRDDLRKVADAGLRRMTGRYVFQAPAEAQGASATPSDVIQRPTNLIDFQREQKQKSYEEAAKIWKGLEESLEELA